MYTKWGDWSSCNHCNTPGERIRIGYCYAMVLTDKFREGVPCRSAVVPYSQHRIFANRKDEKMVASCEEPCPEDKGAKEGKKTFFIDFGKAKPSLPPFVSRKAVYAERGSDLALGCPTLEFDKAVRWQNGTSSIRLLDLHQNQNQFINNNNRVYIDAMDVLHIHNLTDSDAGIYSCWQEDRSLSKTKVIIVDPLTVDEELKGQLLYSGFLFTGIIVVMIGFGVFRNRGRVK
ncbi:Ig-like V-type domain-containing protein FAM187A [Amphiura filiformis]|uniref:Ig-like V-type domain-containing protein FAM187A n=1 Tax=Amphiura filiformis TaxID=82378 RepID=UPI003B20E78F